MNEIERALTTLQNLLDNSIFTSRIDFALEVAIDVLCEQAERSKGCEYCRGWDNRCGANYCPMCGKKLEKAPSDWTKNKACRDSEVNHESIYSV